MLTLLRLGTGEDWTKVMDATIIHPPACSLQNPDRMHGCGSREAAYPYFVTFMVVRAGLPP